MNKPTSAINTACNLGHKRYYPEDTVDWKRNGRSWSCGYCGSMSIEELRECMDAVPPLSFELNDHRNKIYVSRYPHAGDCPIYCECGAGQDRHVGEHNYKEEWAKSWRDGPVEHPFKPDNSSKHGGCSCQVKNGGGPIKFMMVHLNDLPDQDEPETLYRHLITECNRSHREFMAQFEERRLQ